jgi:hypothetical protein
MMLFDWHMEWWLTVTAAVLESVPVVWWPT